MKMLRPSRSYSSGTRRILLLIVLGIPTLSTVITGVQAIVGDLDPTFGVGGKVTTDLGSAFDAANAIAIQKDGKIVAGGSVIINPDFFDGAFGIVRYNTDGSLDTTFGTGGKIVSNMTRGNEAVDALAIQADGKIVAAGEDNGVVVLVRYESTGSVDMTFGSAGRFVTGVPSVNDFQSIAIQSDGKILVAGTARPVNSSQIVFFLLRSNIDGSFDSSFGTGGVVTTSFSNADSSVAIARCLAIAPGGRIVVAGTLLTGANTSAFALAQYDSNGALVPSFGSAGKVITNIEDHTNTFLALALQADGRILAAGTSVNSAGTYAAYLRYNLDGTLDSTFGTGGMLPSDFLSSSETLIQCMKIPTEEHILAIGSTRKSPSDFLAVRFKSTGNLDSAFGVGGKTIIDFGNGSNDFAQALAMQGDGRLVLAGAASNNEDGFDFALARLEGGSNFDACIQDESNGNLLKIDKSTGQYQFTNCGSVMLDGVGVVTKQGGIIVLQHYAGDRRVLARIDSSANRATATIQLFSKGMTFTITDRNTADSTCDCKTALVR